ncbi:MAG: DUF805 domain-containing protein [Bacteroidota bacterium]
MEWYLKVIRQYADFSGRARRKEYWMFRLFDLMIGVGAGVTDYLLDSKMYLGIYGTVYLLYRLVLFIPSLAVAVRRLHDVGKGGWFLLVVFIPVIGLIWLFILFVTEGEQKENVWGPDPKASIDLYDMIDQFGETVE